MLEHSQLNTAVELSLLLLDHFINAKEEVDEKNLGILLSIFSRFPHTRDNVVRSYILKCISWSSLPSNNDQGHPSLHDAFARYYYQLKDYEMAQKHFLRGAQPKEFGQMLHEWSQSSSERDRDLYLASSVLQYLCLTNLKDARILYKEFIENYKIPQTHLTTFLCFLLKTLRRDAYPLFQLLRDRYSHTLYRDPLFFKYLEIIAKEFYGVEPPQDFFSTLFKSFM
eukprot:TRINITY_DN1148_c0_g1_i2.p1 TRINITY_DN1148_c0_g1~~TRINITY_DN1148_c0_g1_i2.p1  ORF type:complete len:225 (-),score=31.25 TRINITY_DN1148_c0_g1_i2:322-996(-)